MTSSSLPIVFLLGPTASGKTAVGIELVRSLDCELISVDSTLVYRRMNIGSAKPTAAELQQAPHQLIDIREPWQTYSAAEFREDALDAVSRAHNRNKVPVLLGGTMLYFQAFEHGLSELPAADAVVRKQIEQRAEQSGWAALHEELSVVDPVAGARIHPNDPQRIQRALEVWKISGVTLTDWQQQKAVQDLPGPLIKFALQPADRSLLHNQIEQRFETMLEQGLVDEVEALSREPEIHRALPSMRAVGYRQAWNFLAGECSRPELIGSGQAATRQLAKRQLTWMRSMENLVELDCQNQTAVQMANTIETAILSFHAAASENTDAASTTDSRESKN